MRANASPDPEVQGRCGMALGHVEGDAVGRDGPTALTTARTMDVGWTCGSATTRAGAMRQRRFEKQMEDLGWRRWITLSQGPPIP